MRSSHLFQSIWSLPRQRNPGLSEGAVLYMFTCMDSKTKLNRSEQYRRSVWFASDVHSDDARGRRRIEHRSSRISFFGYAIVLDKLDEIYTWVSGQLAINNTSRNVNIFDPPVLPSGSRPKFLDLQADHGITFQGEAPYPGHTPDTRYVI